jgi:hypothetical protein
MLVTRWTNLLARHVSRQSATPVRYRPVLDRLEDRTLLTTTTFFLDNTQDYLTLSGDIGGVNVEAQDNQGTSLTTTYQGYLQSDVDFNNGLITFSNSNNGDGAIADNSGNWQPKDHGGSGSDPANYGAKISFLGTGYAAVRGGIVGQDSAPLSLTQDDAVTWEFPSTQHFIVNAGVVDYTHQFFGSGQFSLAGLDTNNQATGPAFLYDVNGDGSVYQLYAPIDITISGSVSGLDYHLHLKGLIVGYGSPGTGPVGQLPAASLTNIGIPVGSASLTTPDSSSPAHADLAVLPSPASAGSTDSGIAQTIHHATGDAGTVDAMFLDPAMNQGIAT